jgi:hypothetical protein
LEGKLADHIKRLNWEKVPSLCEPGALAQRMVKFMLVTVGSKIPGKGAILFSNLIMSLCSRMQRDLCQMSDLQLQP